MPQPVLLVGASTRAMAYSALRAGLAPICLDLFADVDLQAVASVEAVPLRDYPSSLPERLRQYPTSTPVLYTGGLENHPDVYLEIAKERPVWGYLHPDPMRGKSVRNPEYLDIIARGYNFRRPAHGTPRSGWLLKPRAGAGGRGIHLWNGEDVPTSHFAEEFLVGVSYSAVFVRIGLQVQLLGVTRQLVGEAFTQAPTPFTYCGSIGPVALDEDHVRQLDRLGKALVNADGYLQGMFGIDFILCEDELYLLEVNPRYTASTELLELRMGYTLLGLHCQAFGYDAALPAQPPRSPMLGKAIYYAATDGVLPAHGPWLKVSTNVWNLPTYGDIPVAGTAFRQGDPVMTVFAEGAVEGEVWRGLQQKCLTVNCEADST